jgi:hypothetical protein
MKIPSRKATATVLAIFGFFNLQNCSQAHRPKLTQDIPVTSNPVGARIIVDGEDAGQAPLILNLKKNGSHRIRIEREGFNPTELVIRRKLSPGAPLYLLAVPGCAGLGLLAGGIFGWFVRLMRGKNILKTPSTGEYVGLAIGGALGLTIAVVGMTLPESHSLTPRSLEVTLTKLTGQGSTQVQVIYLDSEQLKDIQWLRIKLAGESD